MKHIRARQRILNHLGKTHGATVGEIARSLNLARPNVRYHLRILASDGRIEYGTKQSPRVRGRPERYYSISSSIRGDNLSALTKVLLDEAGPTINWDAVADRLAGESDSLNLPLTSRLRNLVDRLNGMHYQARWEAGAGGPRVLLENCPYAEILEGHPEVCQMDALLISYFLGIEVHQFAKIEKKQGMCLFVQN